VPQPASIATKHAVPEASRRPDGAGLPRQKPSTPGSPLTSARSERSRCRLAACPSSATNLQRQVSS